MMGKYIPPPMPKGEKHPSAKLTAQQVREMRQYSWERGICTRCLSKIYNVAYTTAWDAINLRTWKSV